MYHKQKINIPAQNHKYEFDLTVYNYAFNLVVLVGLVVKQKESIISILNLFFLF